MNETISLNVSAPNRTAGGKMTFTSTLCLALEHGLSTLEAEHFGGAEPMKEMEDH
jgi:hypothetical protein